VKNAAYEKGLVLFGHGRWQQAAEQFRQALAAEPNSGPAHAMLAISLLNTGKPVSALAEADEAVRIDPAWADAYYTRAQILPHVPIQRSFKLSAGDDRLQRLRRARTAIDDALRLRPDDPRYHTLAARIEAQRHRWRMALSAAERALSLDPNSIDAANERARALTALGRAHEADSVIGESLRIDPEFAPTHRARAWSLLRAGRAADAEATFRDALRINPLNKTARFGLLHARAARWRIYRWPLQFLLWRTMGMGEVFGSTALALAIVFVVLDVKLSWQLPLDVAAGILAALELTLLLVFRPVVHLTAWFRR
jgi:tetratricopeptide (TPR) repeat protein